MIKFTLLIFSFIIILLIGGGLPLVKGDTETTIIFQTPIFIISLFLLVAFLFYASWKWGINNKKNIINKIIFLLSHFSIVLILIGTCLGFLYEKKISMYLYVKKNLPEQMLKTLEARNQLHAQEQQTHQKHIPTKMDFKMYCDDFTVERYPSQAYNLYYYLEDKSVDSKFLGSYTITKQGIDLGEYGKYAFKELQENNEFKKHIALKENYVLQLESPVDKHYLAKVYFQNNSGEKTQMYNLAVNFPVSHNGWRFYLMDYEKNNNTYIVLIARSDIGRNFVIIGIWLLIIGIFLICYIKR